MAAPRRREYKVFQAATSPSNTPADRGGYWARARWRGRRPCQRPCGARPGSARGCVSICAPPADAGHLVQLHRCCLLSPNSVSAFSAARTGQAAGESPRANLPTCQPTELRAAKALGQRASPVTVPRCDRIDANGYESHPAGWERPCVFHAPTRATCLAGLGPQQPRGLWASAHR